MAGDGFLGAITKQLQKPTTGWWIISCLTSMCQVNALPVLHHTMHLSRLNSQLRDTDKWSQW